MKKLTRILVCILIFSLLLTLAACKKGNDYSSPTSPDASYDGGINGSTSVGDKGDSNGGYEKKIVRTANLSAETKEYDTARKALNDLIVQYGGYVSSSTESGSSDRQSRSLSLTVRVPAEQLDAFLSSVGNVIHLTRSSVESDDITLQYYDTQSRLDTLRAEKAALDAMLEKATTTADLIAINKRLFDVMEEIDALQTQMNIYKDKVSDSTVYLWLSEVATFSPESERFGTRISTAFFESWRNFAEFWANFAVWFVEVFPALLVLGGIGTGVFFFIRFLHGKKRQKNAQKKEEQ